MYQLASKLLFLLEAEDAHNITCQTFEPLCRNGFTQSLIKSFFEFKNSKLAVQAFDKTFSSPVGLAAGFDKAGKLPFMAYALGFSFMEVGSVSLNQHQGNPRPRLFRLEDDQALINRMGLGNPGANAVLENLSQRNPGPELIKFINITKTNSPSLTGEEAIADIVDCYKVFSGKVDSIVINVSCPNTEDGKTFESAESLHSLLQALSQARDSSSKNNLLVKFSPDLRTESLLELVDISLNFGASGFVLGNTSKNRSELRTPISRLEQIGKGGLSGPPLFEKVLKQISRVFQYTSGTVPIIACGGIDSAEKAYCAISRGASLVEVYTGLVYQGPAIVKQINSGLVRLLEQNKVSCLDKLRGSKANSS